MTSIPAPVADDSTTEDEGLYEHVKVEVVSPPVDRIFRSHLFEARRRT